MNKKRVLLIQKYIPHYRIKVFEELSKKVDLSIIYSEESIQGNKDYSNLNIRKIKLFKLPKIGYFHKKSLKKIAKDYDVVIVPIDSSLKSVEMLRKTKKRSFKIISWGIGVLADRNNQYDSNASKDKEFVRNINNSDAAVFYSSYPVEKYSKLGVSRKKMFVANNTVYIKERPISLTDKNSIVFLGSLYKVKKVDLLVENYYEALKENRFIPNLIIIGDGEMKDQLNNMIDELNIKDKVKLAGEITDDNELFGYFQNAIACFSPNQAGLSVLQSMAYGVPFITLKDAITGGELFNISNGRNGILLSSIEQIKDIILDLTINKNKYIDMGKNAYEFYWKERKISDMVKGFIDAIEYVSKG